MLKGSRSSLNGDTKETPGSDRPRKKLSFREPEIMGYTMQQQQQQEQQTQKVKSPGSKSPSPSLFDRDRERLLNFQRRISEEDEEDELHSQAMRIVRTVGQAFEVCHKLSINSPVAGDDEETVLSEKEVDVFSETQRKAETLPDPISCDNIEDDTSSTQDPDSSPPPSQRQMRLDIIGPPPNTNSNSNRKQSPVSGEMYSSPLSEPLRSSNEQVPIAGTPLSAHHEIQLLREQLEQQSQQTQAALAQVHLLRDQLAAEQAARLEAQTRTHQLLVHNKELLDHITALVSHLQDKERIQPPLQIGGQNVTMMPQVNLLGDPLSPLFMPDFADSEPSLQHTATPGAYVTAPSSPKLRHAFQTQPPQRGSSVFTFSFPTPEQQLQAQVMQRMQSLGAYPTLRSNPYLLASYPSLPTGLFSVPSYLPSRHRSTTDVRSGPDEPITQFIRPLSQVGPDSFEDIPPKLDPPPAGATRRTKSAERKVAVASRPSAEPKTPIVQRKTSNPPQTPSPSIPEPIQEKPPTPPVLTTTVVTGPSTSKTATMTAKATGYQNALASALSSIKSRVTTDLTGRKQQQQQQQQQLQQQAGSNGPPFITRSTSEKVSSRSELMGQVQRTAWARQTK